MDDLYLEYNFPNRRLLSFQVYVLDDPKIPPLVEIRAEDTTYLAGEDVRVSLSLERLEHMVRDLQALVDSPEYQALKLQEAVRNDS